MFYVGAGAPCWRLWVQRLEDAVPQVQEFFLPGDAVAPLELESEGSIAQSPATISGQLVRNESTPRPAETRYVRPETPGAGPP